MPSNGPLPNGSAASPVQLTTPPILGINLGNSYASIAVFTKEGVAECIANEDGERQIACVLAFHGEEMYIGNQAKQQLVKNAQNTITGFRNLLGKKFSEVPQDKLSVSTPVIQHPSLPDTPAYKVKVLQPAPSPLPRTATNTPAASQVATPRSEPVEVERILTVSEVTTIFLASLRQSAEDFLGRKITGVVIAVPTWFDDAQRQALSMAAEDAGIHVLQLLDDAGAIAACTSDSADGAPTDCTQLIVDLGASSLELSLLSIREGLAYALATLSDSTIGGDEIDSKLIRFFAKDFTKKTKTPLTVAPATDAQDKRAEAKLRLAVEHTKRTLSASPGAATCSVESLKDGLDYTGSINRLRFDMEMRSIYDKVYVKVKELAESAEIDLYDIDEIVYIGGSASLPGLDESISQGFTESVITSFKAGTVVGGGVGDPTTILARGCALQAHLLVSLAQTSSEELLETFNKESEATSVAAISRTIGLLVPQEDAAGSLGGIWIPLVLKETPLPCRRMLTFEVDASGANTKVGFELWEVKEGVKIDHVKPPKLDGEDGEDEELEEVKEKTLTKEAYLASLSLSPKNPIKGKTTVQVQAIVSSTGALDVSFREVIRDGFGAAVTATIAAP
ncbi:Hsp70 protein-domain-containing protein [Boletus edulis]|uniref:Actin-like ATPase domain-containing protein n=1 Tax=Boletus edulis BED1 TaxID=1328754 RepID=A0AAD4G5V3_BOLED|nr:Hsp70 protein-domain-containing protein [Boletus edulis]KAF8417530.1 actin-like ATPase domain-containing protein [Boletus edulis BED1]